MIESNNVHFFNKKILQLLFCGFFLFSIGIQAQDLVFAKKIGNQNPLDSIDVASSVLSASLDIDNDADFDFFTGNNDGTVRYYKNIGTSENPNVFEEQLNATNPLNGVDIGTRSTPVFVDIDNDNDYDVFIGGTNKIGFYKNTGTISNPVFQEQTGTSNPLSSVVSTGEIAYTATFVDIDGDLDLDVFIGWIDYATSGSQGIFYYKNIGNSTVPVYEKQTGLDNPFESFNELYPTPIFIDIDADNDYDVFIGTGDGKFSFYQNDSTLGIQEISEEKNSMYPNPAIDQVSFRNINTTLKVRLFSLSGMEVYRGYLTPEKATLDIAHLPQGIYIVVMDDGKEKITKKLIVTK